MLIPEEGVDLGYTLERLSEALHPQVKITPPPEEVLLEQDVAVPMRDGVALRVNVFRPKAGGPWPVLVCAHPYGKDNLPKKVAGVYFPAVQYRVMRQTHPITFSAWTSWEAPDPAYWVPRGYVLVNADLRGFGKSEGVGNLLTEEEGRDYAALIEWAAAQPWSTGSVGLNGVSYLALSQWRAAEQRPPHLKAICPWEGFSDLYRDLARPGGIREDGFFAMWAKAVGKSGRYPTDLRAEQLARELRDEFWDARTPDLSKIEVPALLCGSFSDHNLHSGGTFEAFRRIGSRRKWLYTHAQGKWAAYYSEEALALQARFFDHFLKGADNGMLDVPSVRVEVRASGSEVHSVRGDVAWPLPGISWTPLHLHGDGTAQAEPAQAGAVSFDAATGRASFTWKAPRDTELVGPMKARLYLSLEGADDMCLFLGLRKLDADGHEVHFEGSYGFGKDMVSHGWLRASHRELDLSKTEPFRPVHTHRRRQPLSAGEVAQLEIELLPAGVLVKAGESLRLDVQGHWFHATNPMMGGAAAYETSPGGKATLHVGGGHDAHLLLPVVRTEGG